MTDEELRGWITSRRGHAININSGVLSDMAAEVLRLRAKEAAGEKLAERAAELTKQAKNAVRLGAVTGPHWTRLGVAQMQTSAALTAWEAATKGEQ